MKNTILILLSMAVLLSACQQETITTDMELALDEIDEQKILHEEAFPNENGKVHDFYLGTYEVINGKNVFEGDIILTDEQVNYKPEEHGHGDDRGCATYELAKKWPRHLVYYTINNDVTDKYRVRDAIAHFNANTNLRFIQRTNQPNYIEFVRQDADQSNGCWSYIGMIGGRQIIKMADACCCSTGTAIHEIGHAVGVYHEQSRTDRDRYVNILWNNIQPGKEGNFRKYTDLGRVGFNHGPFDFNSIMMYSPFGFSKNNRPTITRKDGSLYNIQRNGLSAGDRRLINNELYPTKFLLNAQTQFNNLNYRNWNFTFGDWNNDGKQDLIAIQKNTGAGGKMRVRILSGATSFKTTIFNQTIFLNSSTAEWDFEVGHWDNDNRLDLFAVQKNGTSAGKTRITCLSGASNFNTVYFSRNTPLNNTNSNWEFELGRWDADNKPDLYAINKRGASGRTELSVYSGAARYQTRLRKLNTRLPRTNNEFSIEVGNWNNAGRPDLISFNERNTLSGSLEIKALNGSDPEGNLLKNASTVMWEVPDSYSFHLGDWNGNNVRDAFVVQPSSGTGKLMVRIFEIN